MPGRDGFPPGVPCWVDTSQHDQDAACEFYGGLFGWTFERRSAGAGAPPYDLAHLRGQIVGGIGPFDDPSATAAVWNTYVCVDDLEAAVAAVAAAGGSIVAPAVPAGPAGVSANITDPGGADLRLWQPGRRRGVDLVNEPGTWNWSNLETTDPARATAFYRDVFGWEIDDVGGGSAMLRLPGYGDFLAAFDPGLRERHAQAGIPAGFSDAIGWLGPVEAGTEADAAIGGGRSRWTVTFAVDDTDATVDRAVSLGATIVKAPLTVGLVRLAVLRDPQGAEFTVSRYDAEAGEPD